MNQFRQEWQWHLIFWIGYLFIKILIVEFETENLRLVLMVELINLPLKILLVLVIIYYLIPHFLLKEKNIKFIFSLLILVVFSALTRRLTDIYLTFPIVMLYNDDWIFWNISLAFRNLIFVFPVVGFATSIYLMLRWIKDYHIKIQLQQEKIQSELHYLKAQVHPHFLFNTINNIYSLSLDQSPKTSTALLELSDLLSYMLYDCNVDRIEIKKEIELIDNYIHLEKLRYSDRLDLKFTQTGDFEHIRIAPLILLPFVDNCFKHGAGNSMEECFVHIHLSISDDILAFHISNSVPITKNQKKNNHTGIGLNNVKRRLIGEYPNIHDLRIEEKNDTFTVNLKIYLNEKT